MPEPLSEEKLAAIEKADRRATAAPWEWWTSNSLRRLTGPARKDGDVLHARIASDGVPDVSISEENMAVIAEARNALPSLLAEVRIGREALDALETAVDVVGHAKACTKIECCCWIADALAILRKAGRR